MDLNTIKHLNYIPSPQAMDDIMDSRILHDQSIMRNVKIPVLKAISL